MERATNGRKASRKARRILGAAFHVDAALGPGPIESLHEALTHELERRGRNVERQVPVAIHHKGLSFEVGFRADLVVGSQPQANPHP